MEKILRNEKVRFLITGFFNTGLDFILLNTMVFIFGAYPLVANTISVTVGITISYILNHTFVFRSNEKLSFRRYIAFFSVTGFSSIVIQNMIIYGSTILSRSGFGHSTILLSNVMDNNALRLNAAKVLAVLIGMVWNFMFYKFVVFRKKDSVLDSLIEEERTIESSF